MEQIDFRGTTPSNLLVNFQYPMTQVQKSTNKDLDLRTKARIWYSNPRIMRDATWEVLTISMRKPVLINSLSFSVLNKACAFEVYWIDTKGNRTAMITTEAISVKGKLSGALQPGLVSWTPFDFSLRPVTIAKLEIRVQRTSTAVNNLDNTLFSLGIRDILMKRNIYTQDDTLYAFDSTVDSMGNYVRKQVQDFRPELAIDADSYTFWKSSPQPSAAAVVNFYATVGASDTKPTRIDRIWIDPVYTGCTMNLYYSTDFATGIVRPRPTLIKPMKVTATLPTIDSAGMDLSGPIGFGVYTYTLVGPQGLPGTSRFGRFGWIGEELDIESLNGFSYIFATQGAQLLYDGATKRFSLYTFDPKTNNSSSPGAKTLISDPVDLSSNPRAQIILEASQGSGPDLVDFRLIVAVSSDIYYDAKLYGCASGLEGLYQDNRPTGGNLGAFIMTGPIGHLRALVIKTAAESDQVYQSFIASADTFVSRSTNSDKSKLLANDSLDNAIYVGNYLDGTFGYGGVGDEYYTEKVWTPVWKDWKVQRGYFYLPKPIVANHLKLEFSNLVAQPIPIYEQGIKVPYQTFPASAFISSLALAYNDIKVSTSPISGSLNRPNSTGTNLSPNSDFYRLLAPKATVSLSSTDVSGLRNQILFDQQILGTEKVSTFSQQAAVESNSTDLASALVKALASPSSAINDAVHSTIDPRTLANLTANANAPALTNATSSAALGSRVPGFWTLPGGQLKISTSIMEQLTKSSVDTERPSTSSTTNTNRVRFPIVSVHKYDIQYATRDAGIGYFAGMRGFAAFKVDYTVPSDTDQYTLLAYADHTDTSYNMTVEDVDSGLATRPTNPPVYSSPASLTTDTWPSVGTFIKAGLTSVDRGLYSSTQASPFVSLSDDGGTWGSAKATWGDTVTVWGSAIALLQLLPLSNIFYGGEQATQVVRQAGSGSSGITTPLFKLIAGSQIRLYVNIFRPVLTTNTFTIQLVDNTPITGGVTLAQFPVTGPIGKWHETFTGWTRIGQQNRTVPGVGTTSGSKNLTGTVGTFRGYNVGQGISGPGIPANTTITAFNSTTSVVMSANATATGSISLVFAPTDYQELSVTFLINGTAAEKLYISDLYDQHTSTIYSLSNDNGANWYDATAINNVPNSAIIFPKPGNQLKVRVQMYDPLDFSYGVTVTPSYLF